MNQTTSWGSALETNAVRAKLDASILKRIDNAGQRSDRCRGNVASELVGLEGAVIDARATGKLVARPTKETASVDKVGSGNANRQHADKISTAADSGSGKIMSGADICGHERKSIWGED